MTKRTTQGRFCRSLPLHMLYLTGQAAKLSPAYDPTASTTARCPRLTVWPLTVAGGFGRGASYAGRDVARLAHTNDPTP